MRKTLTLGLLCSLTTIYSLLTPFLIIYTSIVWELIRDKEGMGQWFSLISVYLIPVMIIPLTSLAWYSYARGRFENALLYVAIPGLIQGIFFLMALIV